MPNHLRAALALCATALACAPAKPPPAVNRATLPPDLFPDGAVAMASAQDYADKRAEIVRLVWGASGLPATKMPAQVKKGVASILGPLDNLERVDDLLIDMEADEHSIAHHFIAKKSNGRLVIVHQGHACSLGDSKGGKTDWGEANAVESLLREGYSVLGMYMPHLDPVICDKRSHDDLFRTIQVKEGNVVKFFLEPITVSLNYLRAKSAADGFPRYASYDLVGLSGGGWTTTFYAALDPSIRVSVPVAGTLPLYMRKCPPDRDAAKAKGWGWPGKPPGNCNFGYDGDSEQSHANIYRTFGYLDLYALGAQGANRRQIQILNRRDDCCFGAREFVGPGTGPDAWEKNVREYERNVATAVASTNAGSFQTVIDEAATKHEISRWAVSDVILPALMQASAAAR